MKTKLKILFRILEKKENEIIENNQVKYVIIIGVIFFLFIFSILFMIFDILSIVINDNIPVWINVIIDIIFNVSLITFILRILSITFFKLKSDFKTVKSTYITNKEIVLNEIELENKIKKKELELKLKEKEIDNLKELNYSNFKYRKENKK